MPLIFFSWLNMIGSVVDLIGWVRRSGTFAIRIAFFHHCSLLRRKWWLPVQRSRGGRARSLTLRSRCRALRRYSRALLIGSHIRPRRRTTVTALGCEICKLIKPGEWDILRAEQLALGGWLAYTLMRLSSDIGRTVWLAVGWRETVGPMFDSLWMSAWFW
jgi:hypothetical protein